MKKFNYLAIVLMALVFTGCPENPNNPEEPGIPSAGFTAKPFSVSASKQIVFSSGNLQYHCKNDKWRFAPNQTDYIGDANSNIAPDYDGWIDLFGWGTGTNPTNTSEDPNDYQTFVDWGINKIDNYIPNTWRTLSEEEWNYLRWERTDYLSLAGVAQVNGINGLILLPDNWQCPNDITFKSGWPYDSEFLLGEDYSIYQSFTLKQWLKLESTGAVFLPSAGYRDYWRGEPDIWSIQRTGTYWSATVCTEYNENEDAYGFYINLGEPLFDCSEDKRIFGASVRLVKDL